MKKRRWTVGIVFALFLGFAVGLVCGQLIQTQSSYAAKKTSHKKVLAAEEFRLVDGVGKMRASLRVDDNGEFSLALFDKEGKPAGTFGLGPDGRPSVTLGSTPAKE